MDKNLDWLDEIPEDMDLTWLLEALAAGERAPVDLTAGSEDSSGAGEPVAQKKYYGRPVERIPLFLAKLGELWQRHWPDWRFAQLVCNLDRYYRATHDGYDFFYLEEDAFEAFLEEYASRSMR